MPSSCEKIMFDFYLKFSQLLLCLLLDKNDRFTAASWVKRLRDEVVNCANIRLEFLKVLYFLITKRCLLGPFSKPISQNEPLPCLSKKYQLKNIEKNFLELKCLKFFNEEKCEKPVFTTFSTDLRQYAAMQEIPNFGVHIYFGLSTDTIHSWLNKEKALIPKAMLEPYEFEYFSTVEPQKMTCLQPSKPHKLIEENRKEVERTAKLSQICDNVLVEREPPRWGSSFTNVKNIITKKKCIKTLGVVKTAIPEIETELRDELKIDLRSCFAKKSGEIGRSKESIRSANFANSVKGSRTNFEITKTKNKTYASIVTEEWFSQSDKSIIRKDSEIQALRDKIAKIQQKISEEFKRQAASL